jgi:hypothetical protein
LRYKFSLKVLRYGSGYGRRTMNYSNIRSALRLTALASLLGACVASTSSNADTVSEGDTLPDGDRKPIGTTQAADTAWSVTLTASATDLWPTQSTTLTMTVNQDVGPTPFYMTIWALNGQTKTVVARCPVGTTCSLTTAPPVPASVIYIAGLADLNGNQTGANAELNQRVAVDWKSSQLALSAGATTLPFGGSTTLTAQTAVDIGPSPFYVEIFDVTTGTRLKVCGTGTSCSVSVSMIVATTHAFRAYFSKQDTTFPPTGIVEQTPLAYVTWTTSGYYISLKTAPDYDHANVLATASLDVGATPYYIEIFDTTADTRVAVCGSGTTCPGTAVADGDSLVAFISAEDPNLIPADVKAVSNVVVASREAQCIQPWSPNSVKYDVNDIVSYSGSLYEAIQLSVSQPGFEPPNVPALWRLFDTSTPGIPAWSPNSVKYDANDIVSYGGSLYQAIQPTLSQPGFEPPNVPVLWRPFNASTTPVCSHPAG